MDRSRSAETRSRLTVPRWWYAALLIASVLAMAYGWDHSCEPLCEVAVLAPASLSFPLIFVLPRSWPSWAGFTAVVSFSVVSSLVAWLLVRRFAPRRINLWLFLASVVVWATASFALVFGVMAGGGLVYNHLHGG